MRVIRTQKLLNPNLNLEDYESNDHYYKSWHEFSFYGHDDYDC